MRFFLLVTGDGDILEHTEKLVQSQEAKVASLQLTRIVFDDEEECLRIV